MLLTLPAVLGSLLQDLKAGEWERRKQHLPKPPFYLFLLVSLKKKYMTIYGYLYICPYEWRGPWEPGAGVICQRAEVTNGCQLPHKGAQNQTRVIWKKQPYSPCFFIFVFFIFPEQKGLEWCEFDLGSHSFVVARRSWSLDPRQDVLVTLLDL